MFENWNTFLEKTISELNESKRTDSINDFLTAYDYVITSDDHDRLNHKKLYQDYCQYSKDKGFTCSQEDFDSSLIDRGCTIDRVTIAGIRKQGE